MNANAGTNVANTDSRFWVAAVALFLMPFSTSVEEIGVSSNYSFLVLLAFLLPFSQWPRVTKIFFLYAIICYGFSLFYVSQFATDEFYWRQLISTLVFTLPLLIMATRLPFDIELLNRTIVLCATTYAIAAITVLLFILPADTPFLTLKYMLSAYIPDWPQRYAIVLMMGYFIALKLSRNHKAWVIAASLCFFCIVITNLRAAFSSFGIGLALLIMIYTAHRDWQRLKFIAISMGCCLILLITLTNNPFDSIFSIMERGYHVTQNIITNSPLETSGTTRLYILSSLTDLMLEKKMALGSGFAGPYLFIPEIGASHIQYLDVLFRAGPIGLILYLVLWATLLVRSYKYAPELCIALIAWFLYGFMHETTKFSYGAFIFFVLLSLSQNGWKAQNEARTSSPEAL